jgi:hypothetical protein
VIICSHLLGSARRSTRKCSPSDVRPGSYRGRIEIRDRDIGGHDVNDEMQQVGRPWAEVLTLGETRFGVLAGGPFDGRCYPLPDDRTPAVLAVPGPGLGSAETLRYVLRDGLYRYERAERPAA